ncbi:hypothetical protein PVK06_034225 [Gossypium arboreum]|uniref:Uncharacterized protein n=1 Tax=Gossypium arboreum TaxID=29729 RepID=A0ABR0NDM5_GOSAR|nr:hypothetical protein PVK06_034225 [Gossypium arboreum]
MVAPSKSIKEEASKPKLKSLKARIQGIKKVMGKIRKDQTSIREDQMKIGERLRAVKRKCDELRLETQVIARQSAFNRIQLVNQLGKRPVKLGPMSPCPIDHRHGEVEKLKAGGRFHHLFNKGY